MVVYNAMDSDLEQKDFGEFLRVKSLIEQEFKDGTSVSLLETLKNTYKSGSNFEKSGELMKILLQGREMLKNG